MRFKHFAAMASILSLSFLVGCFSVEEDGTGIPKKGYPDTVKVQVPDTGLARVLDSLRRVNDSLRLAAGGKKDSIKIPGNNGGWDDFPNKYRPTLMNLAANMKQLPVPMGTRYSAAPRQVAGSKTAAAQACAGTSEIAAIRYNSDSIFGVDTISYYDALGIAHCDWQSPTTRETHARHMINKASGEVWEKIDIAIIDDPNMPKWVSRSTGRFELNNGEKFNIDAYDVEMYIPNSTAKVSVRSASLALTWQDGYSFKLNLLKSIPYDAADLFPVWGDNPSLGKMMSGPILHPGSGTRAGLIDTVGYIDLYADHTVAIRDWTGLPVAP